MAQIWTTKQQSFVTRFSSAVVALLAANDSLVALATEYQADLYGNGGANGLTDTVVQGVLPAATAALVWSAEGAISNTSSILATIASNRQALEMMRP